MSRFGAAAVGAWNDIQTQVYRIRIGALLHSRAAPRARPFFKLILMLDTQKANLGRIAEAAVASERSTGCPAELQAAQCILETGWLNHAPGNNCFGIKFYAGAFGRQLLHTREWFTNTEAARFLALGDGRTAELA